MISILTCVTILISITQRILHTTKATYFILHSMSEQAFMDVQICSRTYFGLDHLDLSRLVSLNRDHLKLKTGWSQCKILEDLAVLYTLIN